MKAHAVIGAGFGDEGKGLMTDYLSARSGDRTLVVRHNGGAQAGHTVQTPDGVRRVFHHVGAGTLAGADTFLSRHFIVNPMLFSKEFWSEEESGPLPTTNILVDPYAPVTTPYDMLINQAIENQRGANRHGSCGIGINETITRMERGVHPIYAIDLLHSTTRLRKMLQAIQKDWVYQRAAELGLVMTDVFRERADSPEIQDGFIGSSDGTFRDSVRVCTWDRATAGYGTVIFEGAQGLLLDERHPFFPHVTRSRTGLTNVLPLAYEAGIRELEVVYVTRAYMTRHGAGPFPTERVDYMPHDATNVVNRYQGRLRVGNIDVPLISRAIENDQEQAALQWARKIKVRTGLAVTWNDHVVATEKILHLSQAADVPVRYMSGGPTRVDVVDQSAIALV